MSLHLIMLEYNLLAPDHLTSYSFIVFFFFFPLSLFLLCYIHLPNLQPEYPNNL